MKSPYFNGSYSTEDREAPRLSLGSRNPSDLRMYAIKIGGSAHGCSKWRLMAGVSEVDAIVRYRSYLDLVVDDVRTNCTTGDVLSHESFQEIDDAEDVLIRCTKRLRELQEQADQFRPSVLQRVDAIEIKQNRDALETARNDVASARERLEKAERNARYTSLSNEILRPIFWEISMITRGAVHAELVELDRPTCVSYYDDHRGFTTYIGRR